LHKHFDLVPNLLLLLEQMEMELHSKLTNFILTPFKFELCFAFGKLKIKRIYSYVTSPFYK
jgi:hypothetical protein